MYSSPRTTYHHRIFIPPKWVLVYWSYQSCLYTLARYIACSNSIISHGLCWLTGSPTNLNLVYVPQFNKYLPWINFSYLSFSYQFIYIYNQVIILQFNFCIQYYILVQYFSTSQHVWFILQFHSFMLSTFGIDHILFCDS